MSVSLYDIALFIHIASAVHLVGASLLSPALVRRVHSAGTSAELLLWSEFYLRVTRFNPPSAMVLLVSGIYLGSSGWWSAGWFFVSIFAWMVSAVLAAGVIKPAATRMARAAAADAPWSEIERLRAARGWSLAEMVMLGSDVAILWIMVAKPSLVPSIAIFVVLSGAFVAFSFARRGAARPAVAPGV